MYGQRAMVPVWLRFGLSLFEALGVKHIESNRCNLSLGESLTAK